MQRHKLYWVALCVMTLALVAAAPLAAFCDDVTEIDTGSTPVGNIPGLHQGLAAHQYSYQDSYYLGLAFFKAVGDDYAVSVGFLNNGQYQNLGLENSSAAISCPNPGQVTMSVAPVPGDGNKSVITVAAACDRQLQVSQLLFSGIEFDAESAKKELELAGFSGASGDASWATGTLYQTVCGANEDGVTCYSLNSDITAPVQRRHYTMPAGQSNFTGQVDHAYDNQGNINMVGTNSDGELGYVKFPVGSTQADADSFKNLNLASQNKSWDWAQVGAAPDGTLYAAAYNTLEGNLYVFYKAADSPDHWYYVALSSSGGPLGKYLSLAVDNHTNNAILTFADSEGHARTMIVTPDGRRQMTTYDSKYGEPYSTAATAGDGSANIFSLNDIERTMNPGLFQFGVRVSF